MREAVHRQIEIISGQLGLFKWSEQETQMLKEFDPTKISDDDDDQCIDALQKLLVQKPRRILRAAFYFKFTTTSPIASQ